MSVAAYQETSVNTMPRELWPSAAYAALVGLVGEAERAIGQGRVPEAHDALIRAQTITLVLRTSLRPDGSGLHERLAALYDYVGRELAQANVDKDAGRLRSLAEVLLPLREAWEAAGRSALQGGDAQPARPAAAPRSAPVANPRGTNA